MVAIKFFNNFDDLNSSNYLSFLDKKAILYSHTKLFTTPYQSRINEYYLFDINVVFHENKTLQMKICNIIIICSQ